ncbi:MAG: hypothetical protein IPJ68_04445 [Candidatus Moraniibacteriota bacterium]|nr:MAG: hypothetical protein IPJ68_04445 [Candidatus Moranbacteria bacterium]
MAYSSQKKLSESFSEYLALQKSLEERRKRKQSLVLSLTIVYAVLSIGYLLYQTRIDSFPFSLIRNKDEILEKIENLNKKNLALEKELLSLREVLKNNQGTSLALVNQRVTGLEARQNSIEETILYDTDKAITSRTLKDKQDVLNESVEDLEGAYVRINERVDTIVIMGLAMPIILGIAGYLLQKRNEKILS